MTEIVQKGETEACLECGSTHLLQDEGEIVCGTCGLVNAQVIDRGPDWWVYDKRTQKNTTHVGAPQSSLRENYGIQSKIGEYFDGQGDKLSAAMRFKMQRLRRLHNMANGQRSHLRVAFKEIKRLCSQLQVPQHIGETIAIWYRRAHAKKLLPGRSTNMIAAGLVYLVSRHYEFMVTMRDVEQVAACSRRELNRSVWILRRELLQNTPHQDARGIIQRLASSLDLPMAAERIASDLLEQCIGQRLHLGKHPAGIAAGLMYIASVMVGKKRKQTDIAQIAQVSTVTVRNQYKFFVKQLGLEFKTVVEATPQGRRVHA